jgi:hypothetical protein
MIAGDSSSKTVDTNISSKHPSLHVNGKIDNAITTTYSEPQMWRARMRTHSKEWLEEQWQPSWWKSAKGVLDFLVQRHAVHAMSPRRPAVEATGSPR